MALFRAVESAKPQRRQLFADPFAVGFLRSRLRAAVTLARIPMIGALIPRAIDRRWPGPRISALVRTRMIDDELARALADGAHQVVILGAGYDSRPYRIEGIEAAHVFELDHPSTQAIKRERLQQMLGDLPQHVSFVAIDFDRQDLSASLSRAGYVPVDRTFFIWEGVTNYLTSEAVDATLRWIATHSAAGSRLSFTYVHRGLLDGSEQFPGSNPWVAAVQAADEPFTFGLHPDELAGYLAERGLRLVTDASTAQAFSSFRATLGNLAAPPGFYRVAVGEVAGDP